MRSISAYCLSDDTAKTTRVRPRTGNASRKVATSASALDSGRSFAGIVMDYSSAVVAQDASDEIAHGLGLLRELVDHVAAQQRQPVPVSRLRVGLDGPHARVAARVGAAAVAAAAADPS